MLSFIILAVAGALAGAINAVAGGGTLLTLPALIWAGVPPVMANATATFTALPGYVGSSWAFRRDIVAEGSLGIGSIVWIATVGGFLGAVLLVVTPGDAFVAIVPWLLLAATMCFAFGPRILGMLCTAGVGQAGPILSMVTLGAVATYGGYFNGGLGIMLLAVLGLVGFERLHGMNGLKNLLSSILGLVSAVTFVTAGLIAWDYAIVLTLATTAGGYTGARYALRIRDTRLLRSVIVAIGAVMTFVFFFV